jgi:alpha-tubulin suppressor-like RCC1 family protein
MSRPNQFLSPEGDIEDYFVDEYWLIDQYVGDQLWVWGSNNYGKLGGSLSTSTPATTFAGGTNWKQVSAGNQHTAAIKTDGTLWTWGLGTLGRLGNGILFNRLTPVTTFAGGTNWKQVSVGGNTSAIKTDGTLWTWGSRSVGLIGDGTTAGNLSTPATTFAGGNNWKQVSAGGVYLAAVKTDGTLWIWGAGSNGRLGNGVTTGTISTPVTTFAGGNNWKQVSCGNDHAAAIKTDGTLWTWGIGTLGRLGNASFSGITSTPVTTFAGGNNWKQVSCGNDHTAAIKTDGTLWTWGTGYSGKLGNGATAGTISTPVTTFAGGTNWKQVSAGGLFFAAAIKTDGTLWAWGSGSVGQLGNNTTFTRSTPITTFAGGTNWKQVSIGNDFSSAVQAGMNAEYPLS